MLQSLSFSGQTVLVSGGAGFIGSNLCEVLISKGNIVRCLDNFSTGRRDNISHLEKLSNFELIEGDIRDFETCKKSMESVSFIFHQAALGSVPRSVEDPITTNEVNITGFLNMLTAAKESKIKRFIYAASSSTYGDHQELPKIEERIGKPLSPYAITKYVNELYADVFNKIYQLPTIGLRYFNVFGRRQREDGAYAAVIPKFIGQIIRGEKPIIHGDGLQSRDFTYIDNVLQCNILACMTSNPKAVNQVYNVAFGENTSLLEMYEQICLELKAYLPENFDFTPLYGPERVGDVKHSLASIEKAKTLLGYAPSHSFGMGLKEAILWYWNELNKEKA